MGSPGGKQVRGHSSKPKGLRLKLRDGVRLVLKSGKLTQRKGGKKKWGASSGEEGHSKGLVGNGFLAKEKGGLRRRRRLGRIAKGDGWEHFWEKVWGEVAARFLWNIRGSSSRVLERKDGGHPTTREGGPFSKGKTDTCQRRQVFLS